jgi:two-component system, NarL family, invasion response regulator UvrY
MKILICDDHKLVRDGLKQILKQLPEIALTGEAGDGDTVLSLLHSIDFDTVLLDISLPGKNGLEILQTIKTKWPTINVLMLSMLPQEQYAIRALKLGASGYLTKDAASEELLIAVKKVSEGGKYISKSLGEKLAEHLDDKNIKQPHDELSDREFEVMIKLANGSSLVEIGQELFISSKTVSTYRSRMMEKMNFRKNADLTKYCIANRLL